MKQPEVMNGHLREEFHLTPWYNEGTPGLNKVAGGPEMTLSYDANGRVNTIEAHLSQTVTDRSISRTTEATRISDTSTIAVDTRADESHGTKSIRIRRGVTELDVGIARFENVNGSQQSGRI